MANSGRSIALPQRLSEPQSFFVTRCGVSAPELLRVRTRPYVQESAQPRSSGAGPGAATKQPGPSLSDLTRSFRIVPARFGLSVMLVWVLTALACLVDLNRLRF